MSERKGALATNNKWWSFRGILWANDIPHEVDGYLLVYCLRCGSAFNPDEKGGADAEGWPASQFTANFDSIMFHLETHIDLPTFVLTELIEFIDEEEE